MSIYTKQKHLGYKTCEANKKQHCIMSRCMFDHSFDIDRGQEVIHQKPDRLRLSPKSNATKEML